MILLRKGTSTPVAPFEKGATRLPMKLPIKLLCKGTYAPVALLLKGKGESAPLMHPRSSVPAEINQYQIPNHHKALCGLLQTSKSPSSSDPLSTSSTSILKFP